MKVFQKYSLYYDSLYTNKDYLAESKFIHKIIERYSPAKSSKKVILDIGCGTGSHDIFLEEMGYKIHGIDASKEMIRIAKRKFSDNPNLKFYCKDATNFHLKEKFDIVISIFSVIGYLSENPSLLKMFQNAYEHLKKDGIFIFDFWHGPAVLKQKPSTALKVLESGDLLIKRKSVSRLFAEKNLVKVNFNLNVENLINGKKSTVRETHQVRYFFFEELDDMLSSVGFKVIKYSEWLKNTKPTDKSWYAYIVAKK